MSHWREEKDVFRRFGAFPPYPSRSCRSLSPGRPGSGAAAAVLPSRALRGLYGGKEVQFGNKVSKDGGNKTEEGKRMVTRTCSDIWKNAKVTICPAVYQEARFFGQLPVEHQREEHQVRHGPRAEKRVELALRAQREGMAGQVAQTEAVTRPWPDPQQNGA